ncbi:MAG: tetratricopeptide repeat protein [Candidatus Latescibacteria bacterium]|nr:tetratricopeptide repeat protein [Candidatus Latescibacterota bacterium]
MNYFKKFCIWMSIVVGVILGSVLLWPYLKYDNSKYWHREGSRLRQEKTYEEALEVYDFLTNTDSTDIVAWTAKADILYLLKRYREAIDSYNQVSALNPENYNAMLFKAQAFAFTRQHEKAISVYDHLLRIDADVSVKLINNEKPPATSAILFLEGKILQLLHLQRYQEALDVCNEALQKSPQDTTLQNAKTQILKILELHKNKGPGEKSGRL